MAAYTKARNLAVLMRHPKIVQLLTVSLGEEQNAGQLLDQVAAPRFWNTRRHWMTPAGHSQNRDP
jgi:hypothetical protein